MENRYQTFNTLIMNITRYMQKIKNKEMESLGLKGKHVQCLYELYHSKDGISLTEPGQLCGIDKAMISRIFMDLLEKNLVFIDSHKDKKYRNPIKLTNEGKRIANIIDQRIQELLQVASIGLTDDEREVLYQSLTKIVFNLENICKKYGEE